MMATTACSVMKLEKLLLVKSKGKAPATQVSNVLSRVRKRISQHHFQTHIDRPTDT
jgi:hypothetical protein